MKLRNLMNLGQNVNFALPKNKEANLTNQDQKFLG
jgi:hypothetical protein